MSKHQRQDYEGDAIDNQRHSAKRYERLGSPRRKASPPLLPEHDGHLHKVKVSDEKDIEDMKVKRVQEINQVKTQIKQMQQEYESKIQDTGRQAQEYQS